MSEEKRMITDAREALSFMLAGKATFTAVSGKTGTRFTYRVRASKDRETGEINVIGPWWVDVMVGCDNETSYAHLGMITTAGEFRGDRGSKLEKDDIRYRTFAWILRHLTEKSASEEKLEAIEFWHEGRCCRCGRKLTVPESIESGWGPVCRGEYESRRAA